MRKIRYLSLNFWLSGCAYLAIVCLFLACAPLPLNKNNYLSKEVSGSQTNLDYMRYIQENQKIINEIYSQLYGKCEYLVDSDLGTTLIQNLINPKLLHPIISRVVTEHQSTTEKTIACFNYIIHHFRYFSMPETWPTIEQTLKLRKGDCKGLSLLFLSILISFDIECYAAISNGHMWVEAKLDDGWKIFETDSDPDRNAIYNLPGFYKMPMFKIYHNRSEKRIRMKGGNIK